MTRRTILTLAAIALLAGSAALWSGRPVANTPHRSAMPSFLELHNNAHLENVAAQDIEDQTFIYPQTARR